MGCFDNLFRKPPKPLKQGGWYRCPPAASVGWFWTPRVAGPYDYPLDTDFSERFIRPKRGIDYFPVPGENLTAEATSEGLQISRFQGAAQFTLEQGNIAMVELGSIKRATIGPYPNFDDIYVHSFTDISTPNQRKTG